MQFQKIKKVFYKTSKGFLQMLPIIFSVVLCVSLMMVLIPSSLYSSMLTGNNILDPLISGVFGSISAGNPVLSYIIGGELITKNVALIVVTTFMLTWVSVGVVQLPAESLMLGKKFAITRNIVSFIMALLLSLLIVFTLPLL